MRTALEGKNFPYSNSRAAALLRDGLLAAKSERRLSARQIAFSLGYKQPVVLSHMAAGRVAVPLDRAIEIAEAVGVDPLELLLASLEQKEPRAWGMLAGYGMGAAHHDEFSLELAMLAGGSLSTLSEGHKAVLREVVSDREPGRRWLAIPEIPTVNAIREAAPDIAKHGLPSEVRNAIAGIISELTGA